MKEFEKTLRQTGGLMTFRWARLNDKIMFTDEFAWNPDEPEIVDWFVAWWLQ
jgi:hypothetical protein